MDYIDLRSDTVTHPTPAMREAMANAPVGDDVYGDDPTINALEAEAAAIFGKEAGLLVPSGTQGNLIAVLAHCQRGDEVLLGGASHIFTYEGGGIAAFGGVVPRQLTVLDDGTYPLDEVRAGIRVENVHFAPARLLTFENTYNTRAGVAIGKPFLDRASALAHEHGLKTHMDGARIFNAQAALNTSVRDLCEHMDSVTFCLSKGLCAPVGSVLVGDAAFIKRARAIRKHLGGGMRQAGVLAAAGRIALHEMTERLVDDHANAQTLAHGLASNPMLEVALEQVHTNFVYVTLKDEAPLPPAQLIERLWSEYGIKIGAYPGNERRFRLVTHYWVTAERVQTVVKALSELLA